MEIKYLKRIVLQFFIISSCLQGIIALNLSSSSQPAISSQPKNVQKIRKGDSASVVAIDVPHGSTYHDSYPNLHINHGSSKAPYDSDKPIAANSTMISGVATRFTRSGRAYPLELPSRYNRISRYANRNTIDPENSSWGGKWFNKLRRRTNTIMNPASNFESQGQGDGPDEPETAATFLGWGGNGGGYQYGLASGGYGKGVNKSAVGLLGFLSLLSLIQNVLNQTSMAGGRRRKRDVEDMIDIDPPLDNDWDESVTETALLVPFVLPMLNAVTHAQEGHIPTDCTLQPICSANHVLTEKLGERGRSVGKILSAALSKTLKQANWRWKKDGFDETLAGRVIRAGMSGRSGKDCEVVYRTCDELKELPQRSLSLSSYFTQ